MAILRRAVLRAFAPLFLVLAFAGTPALAQGPTPAEEYIRVNIQKGLDILNDSGLGADAKREQFRSFLESLTDFHRVAMFTLGPVARTASDADKEAFATAFHAYAVAVYDKRLSHYNGQQLKVTGFEYALGWPGVVARYKLPAVVSLLSLVRAGGID